MSSEISSRFYLSSEQELLHCFNPIKAIIHYAESEKNLLTGKTKKRSLSKFFKNLAEIDLSYSPEAPHIFHFFYEMGHLFQNHQLLKNNEVIAIEIKYDDFNMSALPDSYNLESYEFKNVYAVGELHFQQKFEKIIENLNAGECYQINLTFPGTWKFSEDVNPHKLLNDFFSRPRLLGAYAHSTYIPSEELILLSNSPECLFARKRINEKQSYIYTMPIKGSVAFEYDEDDLDECWEYLQNSEKEKAELFMITDLLRNDLSRLQRPNAKILKERERLIVPGILHQYSIIASKVSNNLNLLKILKSLFPGGSITGAPKKRVMQIIESLEIRNRGFYCGSTLLIHRGLFQASINIRSAEIDLSSMDMTVNAGGGITLPSVSHAEYREMLQKLKSFFSLFNA